MSQQLKLGGLRVLFYLYCVQTCKKNEHDSKHYPVNVVFSPSRIRLRLKQLKITRCCNSRAELDTVR